MHSIRNWSAEFSVVVGAYYKFWTEAETGGRSQGARVRALVGERQSISKMLVISAGNLDRVIL